LDLLDLVPAKDDICISIVIVNGVDTGNRKVISTIEKILWQKQQIAYFGFSSGILRIIEGRMMPDILFNLVGT
jgi:hypothetical protein